MLYALFRCASPAHFRMAVAAEEFAVLDGIADCRVFSVEFDAFERSKSLAAGLAGTYSTLPQFLLDRALGSNLIMHKTCEHPPVEFEA